LGSEALLVGRVFDDRGNVMSPSHTRKRGIKYRYYLSHVLKQAQAEKAGSIQRIPAPEVEEKVVRAVRDRLKLPQSIEDRSVIISNVTRVDVKSGRLGNPPRKNAIRALQNPCPRSNPFCRLAQAIVKATARTTAPGGCVARKHSGLLKPRLERS
jgi:hypothetical protein